MATKAKRARAIEAIEIESSTGNVFEDLGLPDAAGRLAIAELARVIRTIPGMSSSGPSRRLPVSTRSPSSKSPACQDPPWRP
jgi:hypothetical protein